MNDNYANYFCQKFFCCLEKGCRIKFLEFIQPYAIKIAKSKVGTYPLQAIIESLKFEEEKLIITKTFQNEVIELAFVSF